MLKHPDDPRREPARKRAERKWRNHDVEKRFKEEIKKPEAPPAQETELAIADSINNKKPDRRSSISRAQTKFAKDIRMMMEGHAAKNLALYALSIRAQRYRLLKEKLRRLEARQADNQEQPNV
jgi:hypothetical protein